MLALQTIDGYIKELQLRVQEFEMIQAGKTAEEVKNVPKIVFRNIRNP